MIAGCTGHTKRIDPDALTEEEVGTGLTSQDFRSVCERMARSLVRIPHVQQASTPPKIALVDVVNNTNDYIDADEFTHKIRTLLIKYAEGRAIFLDRALTDKIEQENRAKRRGKITTSGEQDRYGADFFLTGRLAAIDRVAGKGTTTYYRLSFRLTDAATSAIVWEDEYEIKKASEIGSVYR
jgi:uncharacterized protein (TIGR02722 family)